MWLRGQRIRVCPGVEPGVRFPETHGNGILFGKITDLAEKLDSIASNLVFLFDAQIVVAKLERFEAGDLVISVETPVL